MQHGMNCLKVPPPFSPICAEIGQRAQNFNSLELIDKIDIRINVTQQDLAYYNLTSIPLADGSGYAAELGVHHELHCLVSRRVLARQGRMIGAMLTMCVQKKIRHWIHRDYYLKDETEEELVEWEAHVGGLTMFLLEGVQGWKLIEGSCRPLHRDDEGVDHVQGRPFADDVQVGGRQSTAFDCRCSGSSSMCQLGEHDGLGEASCRADI